LTGHDDARTYRDWQAVGRQVRKGEKGFYILEPCKRKIRDTDPDTGQERERMAVYGFKAGARFGLDQTDITDADEWAKHSGHDTEADRFLDALPFVNVARHWGLSVKSYNGRKGGALGQYRHRQSVAIGVENLSTWAHELIHAADDRLGELKERGQHWRSETVAELGGAVLLCCVGNDHDADLGGCWQYIQHYAKANGKDATSAAMSILNRMCKAVALILETGDTLASAAESEAA
jgi:antirestriction protein ArdC